MRWIFRVIGVFVTLAVVAVGALFLIPGERVAQLAAQQFQAATGRTLVFSGAVRPTVWPVLGATSGPVTLANAGWSDAGPMLVAEGLEIGLDPLALLRGEIAVRKIEIVAPRIVLERSAEGALNWDLSGAAPDSTGRAAAGAPRGFTLDRAVVSDGALTFIDHRAGTRTEIASLDAEVSLPDFAGPAAMRVSGMLDGRAFAFDGRVSAFAAALAGRAVDVTVTAGAAGSSVEFEGRAGFAPVTAEGRFDLALEDLPGLFALAGQPMPDLPPELAGGVAASGQVTMAQGGALRLRASGLRLAGMALEGGELELDLPDGDRGAAALVLSGRLGGTPAMIDADIGAWAEALAGVTVPLRLTASLGASRLEFDGRAGNGPLSADGRIDLTLSDLPGLFAAFGQPAPDLPAALRTPISVAGRLNASESGGQISEASFSLAGNRLTGQAGLRLGAERPVITAQLTSGALDLRSFTGNGAGGGGASGPGWPTDRIDASALALADADVTLAAESVDLGVARLGATRLGLTVDRARAVFDLRELRAYEGNLTGQFVINNRSGLSMGGDLRARDMALLPLLRQFAGYERLSGSGSADLNFLAVGNSVDALMRSLSGTGRIDFGRGEIIGFDLAGMLRNLDMSYMGENNRTVYDSISGTFAISQGVLSNDNLRMQASRISVDGRGTVDVGAQRLNYRVVPDATVEVPGIGAVRVPLLITGAWAAPSFRLDLEGMADDRLRQERERLEGRAREEARRLEDQARQRAEEAARDRLGFERAPGETGDDAVRRLLEAEVERGLLRLLDRN